MVAFMSSVDLTLVQIAVTLVEQNVMNQILMTLLNHWLYLKTTTNREEYALIIELRMPFVFQFYF